MHKSLLAVSTTAIMVLLLVTACAEEDRQSASVEEKEALVTAKAVTPEAPKVKAPVAAATETKQTEKTDIQALPIMNQPVDFSSPESVSKALAEIKEQAGARTVRKIESAMGHMMAYDLGVGRDEAKMYKKLNGKTPNQIIEIGTARR